MYIACFLYLIAIPVSYTHLDVYKRQYKIVIDHGSQLVTHYNHMSSFAVSKGDKVKKGQVIGYVGSTGNSTGNHLDFKIIYKGETYNPSLYVNPSNSKPQKSIHSLIG